MEVFFLFVHNSGPGMSEFHELFLSAILARSTPSLAYTPCVWQDEVASFVLLHNILRRFPYLSITQYHARELQDLESAMSFGYPVDPHGQATHD